MPCKSIMMSSITEKTFFPRMCANPAPLLCRLAGFAAFAILCHHFVPISFHFCSFDMWIVLICLYLLAIVASIGYSQICVRFFSPRVISLSDNLISIEWTGPGTNDCGQLSLDECYWYEGYINNDSQYCGALWHQLLFTQKSIIIDCPKYGIAVSCGYSNDMYQRWKQILSLAGVKKGRNRQRIEPLCVALAVMLGVFVSDFLANEVSPRLLLPLNLGYFVLFIIPCIFGITASVACGNDRFFWRKWHFVGISVVICIFCIFCWMLAAMTPK